MPFEKLNSLPTDGKPIINWKNRDDAFLDVAKSIREVVGKLTTDLDAISNASAISKKPQEDLINEAISLQKAQKYLEALAIYEQVIYFYPHHLLGHYGRIKVLLFLKKYKDIFEALKKYF